MSRKNKMRVASLIFTSFCLFCVILSALIFYDALKSMVWGVSMTHCSRMGVITRTDFDLCAPANAFARFSRIHWPYYLENECGPLRGNKCCVKIKGDSGGRTCFGVAQNYNKSFYGLLDVFVVKKGKISKKEEYAKLQIYSKYFKITINLVVRGPASILNLTLDAADSNFLT